MSVRSHGESQLESWLLSRSAGVSVAFVFLLCLLAAHPFAEIGITDDWSYVMSAYKLADTGHLSYNGWATAMLGWQLYIGAALVRLMGHSFTTVRMGTMLIATLTAYLFHRTLVRAGLRGQLAAFGVWAMALSPVFLTLSATFMSDIYGCFAITSCLYGCVRALTATTDRQRVQWIVFAIITNLVCGSARQIAWFGVILLVPGTLVALRMRKLVLQIGMPALVIAGLCIMWLMHWFNQQPYVLHEPIIPDSFGVRHVVREMTFFLFDIPFLLLPISVGFAVVLLRRSRKLAGYALLVSLLYTLPAVAFKGSFLHLLEPTARDSEILFGVLEATSVLGRPELIINGWAHILLTVCSIDGLVSLGFLLFLQLKGRQTYDTLSQELFKRTDVLWLTVPYLTGYMLMLIPRATVMLFHRYAIGLFPVLVLLLLAIIQRLDTQKIPVLSWAALAMFAFWGTATVHDQFSFSRARTAIMDAYLKTGHSRAQITDGWEDDSMFELTQAPSLNHPRISNPSGFYKPISTNKEVCALLIEVACDMVDDSLTPHIHPLYGVAYYPTAGMVQAPFGHVSYSRWLSRAPGLLYVIRLPNVTGVDSE